MPSEPMNIQEQGFRSSLFGFDKNDVLAYMNALANEAQQHELEYNQRAEAAETRRRESEEQLETLQKQTASYQSNQRESQKNANIWQLKHHDLQQKNDDLQKQVEELQKQLDSARQLNTSSLSAPASDLVREAKLEAGKILADARLYAESAEKELKQQADSQIAAFFRLGVAAQPRGGHQQQQRCQRQIDKLARGQHHAAEQQRRQPGRGERLAPVGAEGCIEQQRRKGKAAPQQRGIPAEAGRQMQRHRQQRCRRKHPLAEGRRPDSQRRQHRKEQQVCQRKTAAALAR